MHKYYLNPNDLEKGIKIFVFKISAIKLNPLMHRNFHFHERSRLGKIFIANAKRTGSPKLEIRN